MSATANVVVVEGVRTKSSWFVSDDGGPDSLGKRIAEYLLDGNNDCLVSFADSFVADNGMVAVAGRKSATWVYIVDFENRLVELDDVVYNYHEFYSRCCLDSVQLPYFSFEDDRKDSFEFGETPRTTVYNFDLPGLKSGRPSFCGASIERMHCLKRDSLDCTRSFSLEKEEPVLKLLPA